MNENPYASPQTLSESRPPIGRLYWNIGIAIPNTVGAVLWGYIAHQVEETWPAILGCSLMMFIYAMTAYVWWDKVFDGGAD